MKRDVWAMGYDIKRLDLAEIVDHLYDAALRLSSRATYGTGQRAYHRFASEIGRPEALMPFLPRALTKTELYLSFYVAFLILKPTITKASTILNYEGHVKYFFREQGCDPELYKTPFLKQIRRGIKKCFPSTSRSTGSFPTS